MSNLAIFRQNITLVTPWFFIFVYYSNVINNGVLVTTLQEIYMNQNVLKIAFLSFFICLIFSSPGFAETYGGNQSNGNCDIHDGQTYECGATSPFLVDCNYPANNPNYNCTVTYNGITTNGTVQYNRQRLYDVESVTKPDGSVLEGVQAQIFFEKLINNRTNETK